MKFLLMFLLTFSAFAGDFTNHKEKAIADAKAANASEADIACFEKAENKRALKKCKKAMHKEQKAEKKQKEKKAPAAAAPTETAPAQPAAK